MGKKKREHVVFDKMLVPKKSISFHKTNSTIRKSPKKLVTDK